MKKTHFLLLLAGYLISGHAWANTNAWANTTEIKLTGPKDSVLPLKNREIALEVAASYLNRGEDDFLASLSQVKTPYAFKEVKAVVEAPRQSSTVKSTPVEEVSVVYDDASVLDAIAASFAKQVRGTLAKGSLNYLQLQGGGMLKSGTVFPATIPEIEGQSFSVTISSISARSYTLQMGEASLTVSLDTSSGVTRDNP